MAFDDTSVELLLRWGEAGAEVPTRARASLAALQGVTDAGAVPAMDRLGKAFQMLEAREPTFLVRRAAFAVNALAAEAMGGTGPLGHLAASFARFGIGGAEGGGAL